MSIKEDLKDRLEQLHTAVVSDTLDEMGIEDVVIADDLRPLWHRDAVVGTAYTIQMVDVAYNTDDHFDRILESMAAIQPGDMVVRAGPSNVRAGIWGELLSTAAQSMKAVGAIVNGPTRDARMIEDLGFPVWAKGHSAIDSDGRCDVRNHGVPVEIDGIKVMPGEVIMADYEGIIRIPPENLEEVVDRAEEELKTEGDVRKELTKGRSFDEVYKEYRTL